MNVQNLLVEMITQSTANVFSTMLGVELPPGGAAVESGTPEANDGVVFVYRFGGRVGRNRERELLARIGLPRLFLMLMMESTAVDEDVLDAVAELTNMIVGSVKNDLEPHLGPLGLSLPTVVFGRNFRTKSAGTTEWTVVRFPWEGEVLVVKLCLSPSEKTHTNCHMMGQTCALEV